MKIKMSSKPLFNHLGKVVKLTGYIEDKQLRKEIAEELGKVIEWLGYVLPEIKKDEK